MKFGIEIDFKYVYGLQRDKLKNNVHEYEIKRTINEQAE